MSSAFFAARVFFFWGACEAPQIKRSALPSHALRDDVDQALGVERAKGAPDGALLRVQRLLQLHAAGGAVLAQVGHKRLPLLRGPSSSRGGLCEGSTAQGAVRRGGD